MEGVLDRARKMWRAASRPAIRAESPRELDQAGGPIPISPELEKALSDIREFVDESSGLSIRRLNRLDVPMAVLYMDEMVDKTRLESGILRPLIQSDRDRPAGRDGPPAGPEFVLSSVVTSASGAEVLSVQDVIWTVLDGHCAVLAQGWRKALTFAVEDVPKRAISEPEMEVEVRGPREGFVEDLPTNIGMVRHRLKHPRLRLTMLTLGRMTRSKVAVLYIEGLARVEVVAEAFARLRRIDLDCVLDSGVIEEFIEDVPMSPFPQVGSTERPDRVVAALAQGRVVIFTDSSPFALMVPFSAVTFLQSGEDYYQRWVGTLVTRPVRLLSILISLFLPSIYVAFTTFHQEIIPRPLALAIAVQREMVPYPAIVEALLLTVIFEIVVEATIRLPRPMGQTIGIVGALVIGESAVRANLASNVMVIVVAATALAQFTVMPAMTTAIRLLRLPMLVLSSMLGLFGIFAGSILILLHLSSLRSFGLPYLTPFAPASLSDMKDAVIRLPWWAQVTRPSLTTGRNPVRIPPGQRPKPPEDRSRRLELEVDSHLVPLAPDPPQAKDTDVSVASAGHRPRRRRTEVPGRRKGSVAGRVLTGRIFAGIARRIFGRGR